MIRTKPVPGDEAMMRSPAGALGAMDLADIGVVVLGSEGAVHSSNERARRLLQAESPAALGERLGAAGEQQDEGSIEVPGGRRVTFRSYPLGDARADGCVLLLQDADVVSAATTILRQASRQRVFAFLARDWAHDLKGMLHVIRINTALLAKLLQREPAPPEAAARCLDAIPREVERLDHSIELIFSGRGTEQQSTFDAGAICERIVQLVSARAARQRVEVALELEGGPKDVLGFPDQVQDALLNLVVNALEAMPESGRLVISAQGSARNVRIRVCDSGSGGQPQPGRYRWRPHFVNAGHRSAIGLHVARAVVDSHGGRIESGSNSPQGTCVEITLPAATSMERLGHGSRTDR